MCNVGYYTFKIKLCLNINENLNAYKILVFLELKHHQFVGDLNIYLILSFCLANQNAKIFCPYSNICYNSKNVKE